MAGANPFIGKSIRESGIRETTDGLVVGLERAGQRILNPDASVSILDGDLLWIVGNTEKIKLLKNKFSLREIGKMFGLSHTAVRRILIGKTWREYES